MKFSVFTRLLLVTFCLYGCIKDELPNIEVDITDIIIDSSIQPGVLETVFTPSGIDIYIDPAEVDKGDFSVDFRVSEGATISPSPSSITDYTTPQQFTVTSENGEWVKHYLVSLVVFELPLIYDFEDWISPSQTKSFQIPVVRDLNNQAQIVWACGNEAYSFMAGSGDYTHYPTQPTETRVNGDKGLLLRTLTGDYTHPVVSGNLFIGEFDMKDYDPLNGTHFGKVFYKKPLRLKGYYKYKSGGNTVYGHVPDECKILAVMYKVDDQVKHLTGHTISNSPNRIAVAELLDCSSTPGDEFVEFDLEFEYLGEIDTDLLTKGGYNLTITFASSKNGDVYDGTYGSELYVDNVEIICE